LQHKLAMEALVLTRPGSRVMRLPQVVGRTQNPHTLTNFLRDRIVAGVSFSVWGRAERNLIDIDDICSIATVLIEEGPQEPSIVSIAAATSTPMPEIVAIFERVLGRRANCTIEDKGHPLTIDSRRATVVAARLGIDLGAGYAERLIQKYYGPQPPA
jgi:nucleoside-diphosphate-sugar epimerase